MELLMLIVIWAIILLYVEHTDKPKKNGSTSKQVKSPRQELSEKDKYSIKIENDIFLVEDFRSIQSTGTDENPCICMVFAPERYKVLEYSTVALRDRDLEEFGRLFQLKYLSIESIKIGA